MSPYVSLLFRYTGSDSPTTHTKDVTTHTRAMKLKHQALQDRLEICILELKKLCIREAVSNSLLQINEATVHHNKNMKLKTSNRKTEPRNQDNLSFNKGLSRPRQSKTIPDNYYVIRHHVTTCTSYFV